MLNYRIVVVKACCYICEHGLTISSDVVLCRRNGLDEQHDYLDVCNRFSLIEGLGHQEDYYDKNI